MVQLVSQKCGTGPWWQYPTDVKPTSSHVRQETVRGIYGRSVQMCDVYLIWANVAPCIQMLPVSRLECTLEACMQIYAKCCLHWTLWTEDHTEILYTQDVFRATPSEAKIRRRFYRRRSKPNISSRQAREKNTFAPPAKTTQLACSITIHTQTHTHTHTQELREPNLPAQLKAHRLSKSKEITIIMTASLCHYRTTYQSL